MRNDFPVFFVFPQRTIYPYGPDTRPARLPNFDSALPKRLRLRRVFELWAAVGGGPYGDYLSCFVSGCRGRLSWRPVAPSNFVTVHSYAFVGVALPGDPSRSISGLSINDGRAAKRGGPYKFVRKLFRNSIGGPAGCPARMGGLCVGGSEIIIGNSLRKTPIRRPAAAAEMSPCTILHREMMGKNVIISLDSAAKIR